MQKRRILSLVLCFSIVFSIVFVKDAQKTKAAWPISATIANLIPEGFSAGGTLANLASTLAKWAKENWQQITLSTSKMLALWAVQEVTQAIIGKGGGGGAITDWNNYLNVSPQQQAMLKMNSFFNTVSKGRVSSLNYEGVGPRYDAYLVAEARKSFVGTTFETNLQEYTTDPRQLFSGGNMKGIIVYMQCANNVMCHSMTSTARYQEELKKATEMAIRQQTNGFTGVKDKKTGKIIQPSAIVSSALSQLDQLGTQVIMNADLNSGLKAGEYQIAQGALMSTAARTFNYAVSDKDGKEAIRNKNDQFPFSLSYDLGTGLGVSVGGVVVNTGVGAVAGQTMIGNTCATASGATNGANTVVTIEGRKYDCKTKTEVAYTPPSIKFILPSITCVNAAACNTACNILTGCSGPLKCSAGKCTK